jgi:amino acid transporter
MIWMSSKKLECALAEKKLDSWAKVKYLILPAVIGALAGPAYIIRPYYGYRMPSAHMLAFTLCGVIAMFIVYRGIKQCFYANKNIDDKDFFERFVILGVPPLFKVAILSILLFFLIFIPISKLREEIPFLHKHSYIFTSLLSPILSYILYFFIRNSFIRLGELMKRKNKEQ